MYKTQQPAPPQPAPPQPRNLIGTGSALGIWQLILPYLLVGVGIVIVTVLIFHIDANNPALTTSGISAIVGLVGVLAGHGAASAGRDKSEQRMIDARDKSEQRIIDAMQQKKP